MREPTHQQNLPRVSKRRAHETVVILFLINLLNYMDRFTVAGLAPAVFIVVKYYFDVCYSI